MDFDTLLNTQRRLCSVKTLVWFFTTLFQVDEMKFRSRKTVKPELPPPLLTKPEHYISHR